MIRALLIFWQEFSNYVVTVYWILYKLRYAGNQTLDSW